MTPPNNGYEAIEYSLIGCSTLIDPVAKADALTLGHAAPGPGQGRAMLP